MDGGYMDKQLWVMVLGIASLALAVAGIVTSVNSSDFQWLPLLLMLVATTAAGLCACFSKKFLVLPVGLNALMNILFSGVAFIKAVWTPEYAASLLVSLGPIWVLWVIFFYICHLVVMERNLSEPAKKA